MVVRWEKISRLLWLQVTLRCISKTIPGEKYEQKFDKNIRTTRSGVVLCVICLCSTHEKLLREMKKNYEH